MKYVLGFIIGFVTMLVAVVAFMRKMFAWLVTVDLADDVRSLMVEFLRRGMFGVPERGRQRYSRSYRSYATYGNRRATRGGYGNGRSFNVIFETRAAAVDVLQKMKDSIDDFGKVTVSDFYWFAGKVPSDEYDNNESYGWDNLDCAYVEIVRDGFIIEFPKARYLD
jgi:hypothetical protein